MKSNKDGSEIDETDKINIINVSIAIDRLHQHYATDIIDFKNRHKIPNNGFTSTVDIDEWELDHLADKGNLHQYRVDLYALAHKIGINSSLGSNYIKTLEQDLQFNNVIPLFDKDYNIRTDFNSEINEKELWLEIYPNTRRDDIIDIYKWGKLIAPRLKALPATRTYKKDHLICVVSQNEMGSDTVLLKLTGTTRTMIKRYWSRDVRSIQEHQTGFKRNNREKDCVLKARAACILRGRDYSSKKIKEILKIKFYDCYQLNTLIRDYKRLIQPLPNSK